MLFSALCASVVGFALGVTSLALPDRADAITPAASASHAALSRACPPLAPRAPSGRTRFGVSLSASRTTIHESMARQEENFGRLPVVRIFDPTVPPEGAWSRRGELVRGRTAVTSFRIPPQEVLSGRHDAALTSFFRSTPKRTRVFWTYFHEPESEIDGGDFTKRQYRRAWRRVALLAHRTCTPNLYPTLILTGWTADPASKRSWRSYSPGRNYLSTLAWDPYNSTSRPTRYRPPHDVYRHVIRASRAFGKPWGIAETGTMLVPGDSGTGRARWLRRVGEYLRRRGASWTTYFQSTHDGDFELRDRQSIRAWRRVVSRP